jgi:hypothetical protein
MNGQSGILVLKVEISTNNHACLPEVNICEGEIITLTYFAKKDIRT